MQLRPAPVHGPWTGDHDAFRVSLHAVLGATPENDAIDGSTSSQYDAVLEGNVRRAEVAMDALPDAEGDERVSGQG